MNIDVNYKVTVPQVRAADTPTPLGVSRPIPTPVPSNIDDITPVDDPTTNFRADKHNYEPYTAKLSSMAVDANKALNPSWYGAGIGKRGQELIADTLRTGRDFTFIASNAWLANLPNQLATSPYASKELRSVKESSDELMDTMRNQIYEFAMNPIGVSLAYVQNQVERGKNLYAQLEQNRFTDASSKAFGHELTDWVISLPVLGSIIKRSGATPQNALKTRIDLTDKINPIHPQGNLALDPSYKGTRIYLYKPASNHKLKATISDGNLSITIYAHNDKSRYGGGRDMIVGLMNRLKRDNVEVRQVNATWNSGYSDFYAQYQSNLKAGMSKIQAAENTWSGRMWGEFGFKPIKINDSNPFSLKVYMRKPS